MDRYAYKSTNLRSGKILNSTPRKYKTEKHTFIISKQKTVVFFRVYHNKTDYLANQNDILFYVSNKDNIYNKDNTYFVVASTESIIENNNLIRIIHRIGSSILKNIISSN